MGDSSKKQSPDLHTFKEERHKCPVFQTSTFSVTHRYLAETRWWETLVSAGSRISTPPFSLAEKQKICKKEKWHLKINRITNSDPVIWEIGDLWPSQKGFKVNFIFLRHFSLKASSNPHKYSMGMPALLVVWPSREWDLSPCSGRATRPVRSISASQPRHGCITQIHTPHLSHLVIVICSPSPVHHQWLHCFCPA